MAEDLRGTLRDGSVERFRACSSQVRRKAGAQHHPCLAERIRERKHLGHRQKEAEPRSDPRPSDKGCGSPSLDMVPGCPPCLVRWKPHHGSFFVKGTTHLQEFEGHGKQTSLTEGLLESLKWAQESQHFPSDSRTSLKEMIFHHLGKGCNDACVVGKD